jgi:hypothetical protein
MAYRNHGAVCRPSLAGSTRSVQFLKQIEKRLRARGNVDLAADVNAVVAANVGERGRTTVASSSRSVAYSAPRGEAPRRPAGERADGA